MKYGQILVTGSAGFIGFHLSKRLLEDYDVSVIGIDNMSNYYSPVLKEKRNEILMNYENYRFLRLDLSDWDKLIGSVDEDIDLIIHLGAQAGVRYSLENPWAYIQSNDLGTLNIFELARRRNIDKVIFASSSSVYGANKKIPFSEEDRVEKPVSLYAVTKRANELMAWTYHYLYGIKMLGVRFFTVYGEFGRPDMAYFKFAKKIMEGKPIEIYGGGKLKRDFTYVSDIVNGLIKAINADFGFEIVNLGNNRPVELNYFVSLLEEYLGREAKKIYVPKPKADVEITYADISKAKRLLNWEPRISIEDGLKRFCDWFLENLEWVKDL
ncbi:NAD-dependent epimerase/dehydratase family protein [Thermococcus camini]|uniref:NAD-dependent epimerase/dehydratase domain-containing protein n=1 Tax=Thermococcus camini TaxID=2016373 RepID=A0A7G2D4B4_9EURY|nr:NAD-dependent epimerase/dehydratase family protein [Thermococcus camini]CAD5243339.1 conserved protein of unknown function [Thermococcus camini]